MNGIDVITTRDSSDSVIEETEFPDIQGETEFVDVEAVCKKLANTLPVNYQSKKKFGPVNAIRLTEIANDREMMQIDELVLRGDMTFEEAMDYVIVLPEYDEIRKKIHSLAKELCGRLIGSGELKKAISRACPSKIRLRHNNWGYELRKIIDEVMQFIFSQDVPNAKFRNMCLMKLMHKTMEYIAVYICNELSSRDYPNVDRETVDEVFFRAADRITMQRLGGNFQGTLLARCLKRYKEVFEVHEEKLKGLFAELEKQNGAPFDDKVLCEDNELLFFEINKLVKGKKVPFRRRVYNSASMDIDGSRYQAAFGFREGAICMFRLHFDVSAQFFIARTFMIPGGAVTVQHFENPSSLEFYLDRSTGEICYASTSMPVSNSMKKRDYLILKNAFLNFLLDFLEGRGEIAHKTVEVRGAVASANPDAGIKRKNILSEFPPALDEDVALDDEVQDIGWDKEWLICRRKAKGVSSNDILAAIIRILKRKPIRSMGSHKIFVNSKGKSCPIPIHGTEHVTLGSLKNFLLTMEISPLVLAKELGQV